MPNTPCECPFGATFCDRHQAAESGQHQQRLCSSRPKYFRLYEQRAKDRGVVLQDIEAGTAASGERITAAPKKIGLGDAVASALALIGVTEERVTAWLGRPCGCGERKKKLNRLGEWAAGLITGKTAADAAAGELRRIVEETPPS